MTNRERTNLRRTIPKRKHLNKDSSEKKDPEQMTIPKNTNLKKDNSGKDTSTILNRTHLKNNKSEKDKVLKRQFWKETFYNGQF